MTKHDRTVSLACLEAQPGLMLTWPLGVVSPSPDLPQPAVPGADSPEALRSASLHAAWAAAGSRELGRDCALVREVTLLGSESLDANALAKALDQVRALTGDPVVRVTRRGAEASASINALAAAAPGIGEPPFLHLVLNDGISLSAAWERTLSLLADQGWPLSAEIWLERDDGIEVDSLRDLMRRLVGLRVRPYFLVDGEWLPMERRLAECDGLALVRGLRGWISGLAVPQLVREDRRGRREALVPRAIESIGTDRVALRNYAGQRYEYINPGGGPR